LVDYGLPLDVHNILIVRLGAMGDIIHALPAAAALRQSFPDSHIAWVVDAKWTALLEGNGLQDELVPFYRREPRTWI
jgi:ADP-heptose:LPS heptosyltransferase